MKKVTAKFVSGFVCVLSVCACHFPTEISNIAVEVTSPNTSPVELKEFKIDNCEGEEELSYKLGDFFPISKELRVLNTATTQSGDEYQIPENQKLLLTQAIENAYEQTYQTEIDKVEKTTLSAEPNTHIIFYIEIEKLVFPKKVQFTFQKDIYENIYFYELTRPTLKKLDFIQCPESTPGTVSPTLTLTPESNVASPTITLATETKTPIPSFFTATPRPRRDPEPAQPTSYPNPP